MIATLNKLLVPQFAEPQNIISPLNEYTKKTLTESQSEVATESQKIFWAL